MKNRASSHLFIVLLILLLETAGYWGIHRAALLRGYETSIVGSVRDLLMFVPLLILIVWLSRFKKYRGNWILFTAAILLFSIGMLIQYRLYSDPEYNARNKSEARQAKMEALRTRYIIENYDPVKKQLMGLPATQAQAIDVNQLPNAHPITVLAARIRPVIPGSLFFHLSPLAWLTRCACATVFCFGFRETALS
jgi:hypothetical protein